MTVCVLVWLDLSGSSHLSGVPCALVGPASFGSGPRAWGAAWLVGTRTGVASWSGVEHPALEIVAHDVAPADDRGQPPVSEAFAVLQDGGHTQRRRRLDDEPCVLVEQPHTGLDALLADEHDIVDHDDKIIEDFGDGAPTRDTVGDGVDGVGLHNRAFPPRQRHRRRPLGLDSDGLQRVVRAAS